MREERAASESAWEKLHIHWALLGYWARDNADRVRRYARSVRRILYVFLIAAVIVFFVIEAWLINVEPPKWFFGAYALGQFFSKVSIAYVTSFVFYFFAVHWNRQTDKENIAYHIGPCLSDIIWNYEMLFRYVETMRENRDWPDAVYALSRMEMYDLYKTIRKEDKLPVNYNNGYEPTWNEHFAEHVVAMNKELGEVFVHYALLDSELIRILNAVRASRFLSHFEDCPTIGDMNVHAPFLWSLRFPIEDLKKYVRKKFKGKLARFEHDDERRARETEFMPVDLYALFPDDGKRGRVTRRKIKKLLKRVKKGRQGVVDLSKELGEKEG